MRPPHTGRLLCCKETLLYFRSMNLENRPRVIVADAQFLVTDSLRILLEQEGFELGGVARYVYELEELLRKEVPNLLLTDYATMDYEGLDAFRSLLQRFPGMTIVVLTNQVIKADLLELSKMGIKHMLCKTIDRDELVMALRFALKGRKFFSEEVLEVLMDEQKRRVLPGEQTQLTQTETEIVKMIAEGMTTKQIAASKSISFHTVMTHRKNIFRKLGVNSSSELIMFAIKAGWIDNIEYYI